MEKITSSHFGSEFKSQAFATTIPLQPSISLHTCGAWLAASFPCSFPTRGPLPWLSLWFADLLV